ncbi:MAG: SDR family oxidoreductase [Burkholderiaceae bacterium]
MGTTLNPRSKPVALIVGGSLKLCSVISHCLGNDGFAVAFNCTSISREAHSLVELLRSEGVPSLAVCADVVESAQVEALFATAEDELGKLDVLVNCAGLLHSTCPDDGSDQECAEMFWVNAQGAFNTLREGSRRLNDGGRIINFLESTPSLLMPGAGVYIATRAAIGAFSKALAKDLSERGITVNGVTPGRRLPESIAGEKVSEASLTQSEVAAPDQIGESVDAALVVAFLAGKAGSGVNGRVIRTNSGTA